MTHLKKNKNNKEKTERNEEGNKEIRDILFFPRINRAGTFVAKLIVAIV
jgi:hypothetical protein